MTHGTYGCLTGIMDGRMSLMDPRFRVAPWARTAGIDRPDLEETILAHFQTGETQPRVLVDGGAKTNCPAGWE